MDRDVNSVRNCSVERNGRSMDVTDNSESTHFSNHMFINDLTNQKSPTFVSPTNKICVMLTEPASIQTKAIANADDDSNLDKKPSYLNIACTVNGYSNLTTYDSKIRKDINKSREVSPIRPSFDNILHCPKQKSLASPEKLAEPITPKNKPVEETNKVSDKLSNNAFTDIPEPAKEHRSLIQQRMERLYGSAALVEGFCNSKITSSKKPTNLNNGVNTDFNITTGQVSLPSPSKDCVDLLKNSDNASKNLPSMFCKNNSIDLPVLRHLSEEFRAQLPAVSPKKLSPRRSIEGILNQTKDTMENQNKNTSKTKLTETTSIVNAKKSNDSCKTITSTSILSDEPDKIEQKIFVEISSSDLTEKDGNFFLNLLKIEEDRILAIANDIELSIKVLSNNPDITEDTLGFLRSAAGKARLFVSQKMKQFEGLCLKNLKSSSEEKFVTTADDLQGFWDMIYLQIDHINSTFAEVEALKTNGWKTLNDEKSEIQNSKQNSKTKNVSVTGSKKKQIAVSATALKRESQRKQFLETKRNIKNAMVNKSLADEANGGELNFI